MPIYRCLLHPRSLTYPVSHLQVANRAIHMSDREGIFPFYMRYGYKALVARWVASKKLKDWWSELSPERKVEWYRKQHRLGTDRVQI